MPSCLFRGGRIECKHEHFPTPFPTIPGCRQNRGWGAVLQALRTYTQAVPPYPFKALNLTAVKTNVLRSSSRPFASKCYWPTVECFVHSPMVGCDWCCRARSSRPNKTAASYVAPFDRPLPRVPAAGLFPVVPRQ